ncbi:hypothetical protein RQM65_02320 [Pricia sp. S334]|uniref:SdiA-regulated family protein n=1 Tax=Pricia mediterranea TaxID=3076079 RepID=A0ABU3L2L0_9FLAO|nr:hypothetical protein [Pricia sp. S334]MDT7827498.1 hypothetical protein [Pricia sp. S334]
MNRTKLWTLLGLALGILIIAIAFTEKAPQRKRGDIHYTVSQRWELPTQLREISGIDWLDEDRVAAVQDENGLIFIYNLKDKGVEEIIEFAGSGDYEGIAVANTDAYVLRSDGLLYEVAEFRSSGRTVKTYETFFTAEQDVETLEFDPDGNRLLLAPKAYDQNSENYKGIYAFSLNTKKMQSGFVFKIEMTDKVLKRFRQNKLHKTFRPSDMAINPVNGLMYLIEGTKPKLLIMNSDGSLKSAHVLDNRLFPQPEGITFSPDGRLFISSEGKNGNNASISEMKLTEN